MSQYASAMNSEVRVRRLDAADQRRPVLVGRRRPGALAPGAREHLVDHQHRHVAAHARRTAPPMSSSVLGDRVAQRRRERVELDDVGPRREVRVAAAGDDRAPTCAGTPSGSRARSSSVPCDEALGVLGRPTGGRARRGWARSRGSAPARASASCRAGRGQRRRGRRSARRRRSRATQYGEPITSAVAQVGQRGADRRRQRRVVAARSPARPGCAPTRPSARPRRPAARRARPTPRRARRRASRAPARAELAAATTAVLSS